MIKKKGSDVQLKALKGILSVLFKVVRSRMAQKGH